jgi:hypothetical protein
MPKPRAPFNLDGASIYPQERELFSSLITVIYSVDPSRDESAILNHVEQTFRQIMMIKGGRWLRRRVFTIGKNGQGPSVVSSVAGQ